ncbi:hypothetical protein HKX48_001301 [Thoreauomyces humboldtii]|nr:hypothetical protein HKX48_001301 [Thoreauomyces humboldtii]
MHVKALADMLGEKTSVLDDLEDYYYHAVSGIGKKSDLQQKLDDAVLTTRIAEEERDAARQQTELSKLAAEDARNRLKEKKALLEIAQVELDLEEVEEKREEIRRRRAQREKKDAAEEGKENVNEKGKEGDPAAAKRTREDNDDEKRVGASAKRIRREG